MSVKALKLINERINELNMNRIKIVTTLDDYNRKHYYYKCLGTASDKVKRYSKKIAIEHDRLDKLNENLILNVNYKNK